jgi:signal transduction histidine kinase/CheY-like chemotaxis protein
LIKPFLRNFRNFRTQIFLAFTLMLVLIVIWFAFYLKIDRKIDQLNDFTFKTNRVSKDFSTNINNFQSFLLFGYKDKGFYTDKRQNDIDLYINNLKLQKLEVAAISNESASLNIDLDNSVFKLSKDLDSLYQNVVKFKQIALVRGFKDYGVEGKMERTAELLEKNPSVNQAAFLRLRRLEKDYLLRAEEDYYQQFEREITTAIENSKSDAARAQLLTYKADFERLVSLSQDLGFSQNTGLYGKINYLNLFVEDSFVQVSTHSAGKINDLKNRLFYYQLFQTLILALIGLITCLYISRYFTKDIEKLTLDISNYIKSNFRENTPAKVQKSTIGEVNYLLKSYGILKEKLAENIDFLEKATDKANKTAEFKSQFLANMSHEIRTPLNGVIGMLSLLKSKKVSKEQLDYIETAEHSAVHLLGIVNMILDHSKMEVGKIKLDSYPINLKRELTKLVRMFDYRVKDKNIAMTFVFDGEIATNILGDNLRLLQILINLIDNAIKFTNEGEVSLQVKLLSRNEDVQYVNFTVMDSGIGIDVTKTENLLMAFEQADLTTTRKYGGTGLGLTISNQLIQLMGGKRLDIMALPTGGSSFSFSVPFKINPDEPSLEQVKDLSDGTNHIKIAKALLAEDNLINQKVLAKLLEKLNIQAEVANNGKEAVALYLEKEYDIIFMDLHMPEMDGFEATTQIQASSKYQQRSIPIIAVTASVFEQDKVKAISNGMDDFITKPVILKSLEEVIAKQMSEA